MKLLSLECEFFRQHVQSRISFESGLTGIIGPNGAGKSTLVEAIAFALFGARAIRGKVEALSTRGRLRKKARVVLRFEHAGHVFHVERSTTDASLFIDGNNEQIVNGNRAVSDRITSYLGLSYEEFVSTYFTEQKGLEFLSGKRGATERARFIIQMMGFDKLERAQELLRREKRDLRHEIQGLESTLKNVEALSESLKIEKSQLKQLSEAYKDAERVLSEAKEKFSILEIEWKDLQEDKNRFDSLKTQIDKSQFRLDSLKERKEKLANESHKVELQISQIKSSLNSSGSSEKEVHLNAKNLQADLVKTEKEIEKLRYSWQERRVAARSDLEVEKAALKAKQKEVERIKSLSDQAECPTCGQELGATSTKHLHHGQEEIIKIEERINNCKKVIETTEKEPQEITSSRAHLSEVQADVKKNERLIEMIAEANKLSGQLDSQIAEQELLVEQISEHQKSFEESLRSVEALEFSENEFVNKKAAYESGRQLFDVARMQRLRSESAVDKQKALLERTERELEKAAEHQTLLEQRKRDLLVLDESDQAYSQIRNRLNASIRPRLAELSSEFLTDLTDGRYSSVEIGQDFTPTVYEDGEPKPVISGGEQDVLNLCVRLALSQLVAERAGHAISLLVLDEVFGSLDETRRANVLLLLEKLQTRFEQVLLITHLDDIKEGVEHFIQVAYDEGAGEVSIDALDSYELLAMNI